jgi:hypothetical protein
MFSCLFTLKTTKFQSGLCTLWSFLVIFTGEIVAQFCAMIHSERRTILHNVEADVGILYSTCKIILVWGVENENPSKIHHALSISKFLTKYKWHCFSSHSTWQIWYSMHMKINSGLKILQIIQSTTWDLNMSKE